MRGWRLWSGPRRTSNATAQLVLKAAVEGRLTAEWRAEHPDVEPASELLKRLLTERRHRWEQDQLAKYEAKGKKPPQGWKDKYKEPPPADTKILPELPPNWCWVAFGQICTIQGGFAFKSSDYKETGIPLVRISNLTSKGVDLETASVKLPDFYS